VSRNEDTPDGVRAAVETCIAERRMPGASWWTGPRLTPRSRGAAGLSVAEPVSEPVHPDTPFDLASLTKPLATATLAGILVAEGRLTLDDPAARWIPELRRGAYASLTLRDLGTHRGGFPAWHPLYLEARSRESYAERIASLPPVGPPGATLYSDLPFILLGIAVERAAGSTLDVLFRDRIAGPLGLARAGFATDPRTFADAAATERGNAYERRLAGQLGHLHAFRRHVLRGEVHDGNAWGLGGVAGHAGLFATADEVAILAGAVLDPSRLGLGEAARDPWLRPAGGDGARTFGWLPAAGAESVRGVLEPDAVGHFGFTGTSVWVEPGRGAVHVLLTNRVHPEVPEEPFAPVRRAFHVAAAADR
jgi:CubicO group peptidase (beta-lactamase class C family)